MNARKKQILRFAAQLLAIAALVGIDQILKAVVTERLKGKGQFVWIPGFLSFTYAENTGAAFSMFSSDPTALSVLTGALLTGAVIAMFFLRNVPKVYHVLIPAVIAGGVGNLVDRCLHGYVIDYIETLFVMFPIFNFADCLITCGCFAMIGLLIFSIFRDEKKSTGTKSENAEPEEAQS